LLNIFQQLPRKWQRTGIRPYFWRNRYLFAIKLLLYHVLKWIRAKKLWQFTKLYVKAIWVKTRKQQKWFWDDIITYWIPDWPLQD